MKRISLHTEIPVEQIMSNLLFACFKYVHIILKKKYEKY